MPWCQLGTQDFGLINHKLKSALKVHCMITMHAHPKLLPYCHQICISSASIMGAPSDRFTRFDLLLEVTGVNM